MKTNYLGSEVMCNLKEISAKLGQPSAKNMKINSWNCGGGCEGLSTPII